ncbi:MAG: CbtB-domain containing protein [Candidatus Binatia bacterium]
MEKSIETLTGLVVPESLSFLIKSALLLVCSGMILYLLLAATYPPVHDTLHHFRHSLAIVPCH